MADAEKLPGMETSEWHQIEVNGLHEAAADAKARGEDEEAAHLWDEAGKANEQGAVNLFNELRGED
jgi:hypothetical protein